MKQHLILSCSSIPTFFKQSSYLYSDSITRARLITRILRTTGMSLRVSNSRFISFHASSTLSLNKL
ncbi:hypothetical protein HanXRQr2_Chr01g0008521 [Helianthus annuus]|uniref:Uncharacterized protein n=1 Tax=Helianthus annuus TaxID=4232 RepID=A0A9K3JUL1_HELAN|nr:hypothetical protein HanXRQr2_Chr01g0008521 [Helianthus annuus]